MVDPFYLDYPVGVATSLEFQRFLRETGFLMKPPGDGGLEFRGIFQQIS
jgi:hypothetical protein